MYGGGYDPYGGGEGGGAPPYEHRFRPASRTSTPRSDRGAAAMYPTYDAGKQQAVVGDDESVYEERDIGTMFAAANSIVGGSNPAGPSYANGSAPYNSLQAHYRTSLDVNAMYGSPRSPAPSSAPAGYSPYGGGPADFYGGQSDFPGAFPAPRSEPGPGDYMWYAGLTPGSAGSSDHRIYGVSRPSHRSSAPPPGAYSGRSGGGGGELPANLFGINAPHHHPSNRLAGGTLTARDGAGGGGAGQHEHLPDFPRWSRTWYDGHLSANGHAYTAVAPPSGVSGWEAETLSRSGGGMGGSMPSGGGVYGQVYGERTTADMVKEERIRMLEKQFGKPKITHKGGKGVADEEDEEEDEEATKEVDDDALYDAELPYGAVTSRGKLVTKRRKWRIALRWLIGVFALACCGAGLGGALLIKPSSQDVPAARGSIASYILYGCSVVTLLAIIYLYVMRPCCCDPMRKDIKTGGGGGLENGTGGMIIPVLAGAAGGKQGKKRFGGKGKRGMMMAQQAPTVNLIVNPEMLGMGGGGGGGRRGRRGGRRGEEDESDDDSNYERLPGDARRSSRRKHGIGVLGNMQMQRRWQIARRTLKLETVWDGLLCVAWLACVIVAVGYGKTCPPGTGNGWCNYYNGAIACGAILSALFLFALILDSLDLKISKKPPKPPM